MLPFLADSFRFAMFMMMAASVFFVLVTIASLASNAILRRISPDFDGDEWTATVPTEPGFYWVGRVDRPDWKPYPVYFSEAELADMTYTPEYRFLSCPTPPNPDEEPYLPTLP